MESNEDSSQQRMVRNRLFTGSNHMYSLQLITMPSVVAVVVVGMTLSKLTKSVMVFQRFLKTLQ